MFDDFMHNELPDMYFNQPHQDAMLHAQNQTMEQAARALQDPDHTMPIGQSLATEPVPLAGFGAVAMNLALLFEATIEKLFGWK